jgi:hypothetical protein
LSGSCDGCDSDCELAIKLNLWPAASADADNTGVGSGDYADGDLVQLSFTKMTVRAMRPTRITQDTRWRVRQNTYQVLHNTSQARQTARIKCIKTLIKRAKTLITCDETLITCDETRI